MIMKKDMIVGGFSGYNWDKIKYWVNSINKCGFDGTKVMIAVDVQPDLVKKLVENDFVVISTNMIPNIPIHVQRFFHIWNFLRSISADEQPRYVITTDVKDVVFQKNPSLWLEQNIEDKKLIAASESMKYKDEAWGNDNLMQAFGPWFHQLYKDNEIFNVGTIAGTHEIVRDLCLMIFQMSINRPIPIVDQAVYNFLLWNEPYRSATKFVRSEDSWAAQLGTTADPSKINQFRPYLVEDTPIMKEQKVLTSKEKEFTIVHQYDRVPEWKLVIENKYS
jgi:hypothetical protein